MSTKINQNVRWHRFFYRYHFVIRDIFLSLTKAGCPSAIIIGITFLILEPAPLPKSGIYTQSSLWTYSQLASMGYPLWGLGATKDQLILFTSLPFWWNSFKRSRNSIFKLSRSNTYLCTTNWSCPAPVPCFHHKKRLVPRFPIL